MLPAAGGQEPGVLQCTEQSPQQRLIYDKMSSSADKSCFVLITAFRAGSCGFSSLPVQDFKEDVEGEWGVIRPSCPHGGCFSKWP